MNSNISNSETSKSLYSPFVSFSRRQWIQLLANKDIDIKDFNINSSSKYEIFNQKEVLEIYKPLCYLINFYLEYKTSYTNTRSINKTPFIFGLSGSVAVGKSTTAKLLKKLLSHLPSSPKVQIVTTDSFLYSNMALKKMGLMNKKGFPESYNQKELLNFIYDIKYSKKIKIKIPIYSHVIYDVVKNKDFIINNPDILIVEGLNIFTVQNESLSVGNFFDLNLYIDAKIKDINLWYIKRFMDFKKRASLEKESHYNNIAKDNYFTGKSLANAIWKNINEKNLKENIIPIKNKVDIILKKNSNHKIESILIKEKMVKLKR